MTIDELRQKLEDACEYAIKVRHLRITPGSFGVIDGEPTGSGCVCPIGALELYTKTRRGKLGSDWGFNYDTITNGFDLYAWQLPPTEEFDIELYELGVDLRKKFYKPLSARS